MPSWQVFCFQSAANSTWLLGINFLVSMKWGFFISPVFILPYKIFYDFFLLQTREVFVFDCFAYGLCRRGWKMGRKPAFLSFIFTIISAVVDQVISWGLQGLLWSVFLCNSLCQIFVFHLQILFSLFLSQKILKFSHRVSVSTANLHSIVFSLFCIPARITLFFSI